MNLMLYFTKIINYFYGPDVKVLYSSENIMVIDKQYDIKINSNDKNEITVQTLLKKLYPSLANKKLFHEYYFPHRLDFATSGLLCIPMNKKTCRVISNVFLTRKSKKYYIALVRGLFSKEIVDLDMPIGEDVREKNIQKMCTADSKFCRKSRTARTVFIVLEEGLYDNYPSTKVLVRPVSGRRHQIRIHCSHLGHTIVGDYTYSNRKDTKPFRMFLHSLRLVLPNSVETVDVETTDPFIKIENWKLVKKINDINQATYSKFDQYI